MKKKDAGMLGHFLAAILTVFCILLVWFGFTVFTGNIDRSTEINQVARRYLLRMETDGYLTPENRELLTAELEELGVSGIDLTGTSFTDVGYGREVRLHIRGNATVKVFELEDLFKAKTALKKVPLEINKVSIAKN